MQQGVKSSLSKKYMDQLKKDQSRTIRVIEIFGKLDLEEKTERAGVIQNTEENAMQIIQ